MEVLRKKQVSKIIGLSCVHIMRKVKAGDFPRPIRLGANSIGWLSTDVKSWIDKKVAERDAGLNDATTGDAK